MRTLRAVLLVLGTAVCAHTAEAQELVAPAYPVRTSTYYNAAHRPLPSADGAAYRVDLVRRDSLTALAKTFYASGKLKAVEPYGHWPRKILHGTKTTWYESGQQHTKEDYVAGRRQGELLVYYPDGTLRRRDQFVQGVRTAGECFGADGKAVDYFDYWQLPVYSEGAGDMQAIAEAAVRKGIFPEVVARLGMDARVQVHFTVSEAGHVEQVYALLWKPQKTYPQYVLDGFQRLQQEAEWIVAHLKSFRPALLDGQPVPYEMTVPINFRVLD